MHDRRWLVLALSALVLAASGFVVAGGATLRTELPEQTEAAQALRLIDDRLPAASANQVFLVFSSRDLSVDDPRFRDAMLDALAPLRQDARIAGVLTPFDDAASAGVAMVSADGRHALAILTLPDDEQEALAVFGDAWSTLDAGELEVTPAGSVAVRHELSERLESDLRRAELLTMPLVLALLLVVFGSLVAAVLPLGVGVLAVMGGLAGVFLLARETVVSEYAVNIVTLIGLGVAIDYSLFIVSRFREERTATGDDDREALARTLDTAGRAVAYSGLTVAVGLAGLLFFQGTYLASMGMAGAIVVALSVFCSLTFLPALLAVLGRRVEAGRVPFAPRSPGPDRFWRGLSEGVMRRPLLVLLPVLAVLLLAGAPFLDLQMATSEVDTLPPDAKARAGRDLIQQHFSVHDPSRALLVVDFPDDPLAPDRVRALHALATRLDALPSVAGVTTFARLDPSMDAEQHVAMLSSPREHWPAGLSAAVAQAAGERLALVAVALDVPATSDEARALVRELRETGAVHDGRVLVTGATAIDVDTTDAILERVPIAVGFVMIATYLLILVQVRSVVIPLKAIAMNLLSLTASFGALVWIFQEGNLSGLLNFTPQPIDPSLPVILFCIVFGLSMDYEVLLLSRIHEEYLRSGDNRGAVAEGLASSGRLITGAAAIMVVVFSAFALSDVFVVKAIGLGLALAVAVDATLVRALVVPSTMRLMGRANWWAPRWLRPARAPDALDQLLARLELEETESREGA